MTHPPHGDDDRDDVRPGSPPPVPPAASGWGRPDPGRAYPPPRPEQRYRQQPGQQYGPPEPQFGPPSQYGPPPYGQQYGPPQQYDEGQYGPPPQYGQYGQPGEWDQPPQPAGKPKRRRGLWLAVLVLLIVVLVVVPTLTRSKALDPRAVQRDVAGQYEARFGVPVDLRCSEEMTIAPGRTYQCSGTTADRKAVTITIRITDENAGYTWSAG
jgi:uncharacterized protein DUF4333